MSKVRYTARVVYYTTVQEKKKLTKEARLRKMKFSEFMRMKNEGTLPPLPEQTSDQQPSSNA